MPSQPAGGKKHYCATCNNSYSTNSHLRRHEALHTGKISLSCPSCSHAFTRVDVARRHIKRCSPDGGAVVLPQSRRGKQRTACDQCSQRKLSCNAIVPCTRCRSSESVCTYRRLNTDTSSGPVLSLDNHRPSMYMLNGPSIDFSYNSHKRVSIDFLIGFTDPTTNGNSIGVIVNDIHQSDAQILTRSSSPQIYSDAEILLTENMSLWDLGDCFPNVMEFPALELGNGATFSQSSLSAERPAVSIEALRMNEIIAQLSATHESIARDGSRGKPNFDMRLAETVFTEHNLTHFVWLYFHQIHMFNPIIHRPTFNIETASLPLVLAVFLFGSMISAPRDAAVSARDFFDIAEEYIFSHPTFTALVHNRGRTKLSRREIEILQAALSIEIVQNRSMTMDTRRRFRLDRHPCLIAAMRSSNLFAYKREHLWHDLGSTSWQEFIADEVLTRLAVWTFFSDSIFALFRNNTPEIPIAEMMGDFPCPEDIFEAETASEFEWLALRSATRRNAQSPSELTLSLFNDTTPEPHDSLCKNLTGLQLLICICALLSITLTSRSSFITQASAEVIFCATDRWRTRWDAVLARSTCENEPLRHQGFVNHALELWWLTRTLIKVNQLGDTSSRYMHTIPTDSVNDLHDFIRKYKDM